MRTVDVGAQAPLQYIRALVLGGIASGKTHFAATFPKPLFISDAAEGGFATIQTMDKRYWWNENEPPAVWAIEEGFPDINKIQNTLEALKAKGDFPFRTIVIDPISIYADRMIAEMEDRARKNLKEGKEVDKRAIYGDLLTHLRVVMLRFHALPAHVVWLCHTKEGGPAIPGQSADKFPAYMDFKWMCTNTPGLNGANYELQTAPTGAFRMLGGRWSIKDEQGKRWGLPSPMIPSFKCVAKILGMEAPVTPDVPGFPDGAPYIWPPPTEAINNDSKQGG